MTTLVYQYLTDMKKLVLLLIGLIVAIIVSLPFLASGQAEPAKNNWRDLDIDSIVRRAAEKTDSILGLGAYRKEYALTRYCEVYQYKIDSCFDVRGKVTVTNKSVSIYIPGEEISFRISSSFRFRSHIYYHLVQPWYDGFLVLSEGNRDLEGNVNSYGILDVSILGQGVYTARLSLQE